MEYLAIIGVILGIFGLWIAMQKRLQGMQEKLAETFKALSFEIMERNNRSFLELANVDLEARHKAIDATLKQLDAQQRELEKRREGAYAALSKQLEGMLASEKELRQETAHLVQALRSPQIRGSWGQLHLRRVVELAGLLNNCDFFEQQTVQGDGKIWRPDLVVRLPGERHIVVDAKTPLDAYLDASDAGDDLLRKKKLQEHAAALRKHIRDLSTKEYWKLFSSVPEYVILFLPAEAFFSAALQVDPALIEVGADQNIIVATPTTLIAILRAIAFSWKQDQLSKNAQEIARLGAELYDRLETVCEYWGKVGKNLNTAVDAYNQSIASLENRLLVTARKLKETSSIVKELPEPENIDKIARTFTQS